MTISSDEFNCKSSFSVGNFLYMAYNMYVLKGTQKQLLTLELAEWFGQIVSLTRSPNLCFMLKAFKLVVAWLI